MKKILALLLVLCTVFAVTACGGNPENMKWENYDDVSFKEMLETGMEKLLETDVTVTVKEGWDTEELDDSDVDEAYTFVAVPENFEIDSFEFFMMVKDGVLVAKGCVSHEPDEDEFFNKKETNEVLEELANEL